MASDHVSSEFVQYIVLYYAYTTHAMHIFCFTICASRFLIQEQKNNKKHKTKITAIFIHSFKESNKKERSFPTHKGIKRDASVVVCCCWEKQKVNQEWATTTNMCDFDGAPAKYDFSSLSLTLVLIVAIFVMMCARGIKKRRLNSRRQTSASIKISIKIKIQHTFATFRWFFFFFLKFRAKPI